MNGITKEELEFEYLDIDNEQIKKQKQDILIQKEKLLNGDTLEIDLGELNE